MWERLVSLPYVLIYLVLNLRLSSWSIQKEESDDGKDSSDDLKAGGEEIDRKSEHVENAADLEDSSQGDNFVLEEDEGADEEDPMSTQESLTTSLYEVVNLNDVPKEAGISEVVENKKKKIETEVTTQGTETTKTPDEIPKSIQEELAQVGDGKGESHNEVEQIELTDDDKSVLTESIIIVDKEPDKQEKNLSLNEGSETRRITRGFLNSDEMDNNEIELLKEDKSRQSNVLEESDFTESEEDTQVKEVTRDTKENGDEKKDTDEDSSGNDGIKSKLNESFKVDLRPSWMVNKTSVKNMKESTASIWFINVRFIPSWILETEINVANDFSFNH